jgi:hypothetical protein
LVGNALQLERKVNSPLFYLAIIKVAKELPEYSLSGQLWILSRGFMNNSQQLNLFLLAALVTITGD